MPWYNKQTGAYARESQEAYENALMAWSILYSKGWSLLAFCGFWGNVGSESGWNPWRWQSDIILPFGDPRIEYQNGHAYGLVQWDPASKYINGGKGYNGYKPNYANRTGGNNEGTAQVYFMDETAVSSGQYFPNPGYNYQLTYEQYKQITLDNYSYEYAAKAWFYNYERGTWDDNRTASCMYFYGALSGVTPPPPPEEEKRFPIWLMFKIKERNG